MDAEESRASVDRVSSPSPETELAARPIVATEATSPEDPADRWLVWLRWVAVAGMAATILVADGMVDGLNITGMMSILLGIGASNLVWLALLSQTVRRRVRRGSTEADSPGRRFVEVQLALDVVSLSAMLWLAGGVENPFAVFLTFQIALAGLLCTPRATIGIAVLTVVSAITLSFAPALPRPSSWASTVAEVVSIVSLSAILAVFVAVYARRLSQLRVESARNERLAVLGRLVGAMSHELNTPLATVLLLSRDLASFHSEMSPEEVKQLAESIVREVERSNEIIGLVRGHVGPDQAHEPIELCAFVEEHARAELDRLGFAGERRFVGEGPIVAPVMRRALLQILTNLLRNASEASVLGRRKRIVLSVQRTEVGVEIAVEDRGPGFAPDILARLGEPFQTTKEDRGGMGLGLFVSARLAKQMGASLSVHSHPESGARVVLLLPEERRLERSP